MWKNWCFEKRIVEEIANYELAELKTLLGRFYAELKKNSDGYEPESLKVMIASLDRHLVKWSSDEYTSTNLGGTAAEEAFSVLMEDNFLRQLIKGPTNIAGNKLDLLLCNFSEVIDHVFTTSPSGAK